LANIYVQGAASSLANHQVGAINLILVPCEKWGRSSWISSDFMPCK